MNVEDGGEGETHIGMDDESSLAPGKALKI